MHTDGYAQIHVYSFFSYYKLEVMLRKLVVWHLYSLYIYISRIHMAPTFDHVFFKPSSSHQLSICQWSQCERQKIRNSLFIGRTFNELCDLLVVKDNNAVFISETRVLPWGLSYYICFSQIYYFALHVIRAVCPAPFTRAAKINQP
jgi:hypothetical protein